MPLFAAPAVHITLVVGLAVLAQAGCLAPAGPADVAVPAASHAAPAPCPTEVAKWHEVVHRNLSSLPGQPAVGEADFTPRPDALALRASAAVYGVAAAGAAWRIQIETAAGETTFLANQDLGPTSGAIGSHNQGTDQRWDHNPGDAYRIEWNVDGLVQDLRVQVWQLNCV